MRRAKAWAAVLVVLSAATGCIRREGRNSDCRWPGEASGGPATPRHLSADAEFAEDLAIRYADTHHGLRTPGYVSGEAYSSARDSCMRALFQEIGKTHDVPPEQVAAALGRNRGLIDLAINIPFAVTYSLAAFAMVRFIRRRYPAAEYGQASAVVMCAFVSLVFAALASMAGEQWSWVVETNRIGNAHMSYRVQRQLWPQHRAALFASSLVIFWAIALASGRRQVSSRLP